METVQGDTTSAAALPRAGSLDMKLEVVVVPVSDVDVALGFYRKLGWRFDGDFVFSKDYRVVQVTPPGSGCSVIFGQGVTADAPGSAEGLILAVNDVDAARAALEALGVEVSETFHDGFHPGHDRRQPGPDPQRRSYQSFVSFRDPDGNEWVLQEIRERLPGRISEFTPDVDVASLTALLRETEEHHGAYEKTAPKHHWSAWYAAYMVAREAGKTPDEAYAAAVRHLQGPH